MGIKSADREALDKVGAPAKNPKAGKGMISNLAKTVAKAAAPALVDAASSFVKNKIAGTGKRKVGRPKKAPKKAPKKEPKKST